jgi:hypothetical protein
MTDYDALVADLIDRYPHLVMVMSGPWRDRGGEIAAENPWICNFKNCSMLLREVHPGSGGATMLDALKAGIQFLDDHADEPDVRDNRTGNSPTMR